MQRHRPDAESERVRPQRKPKRLSPPHVTLIPPAGFTSENTASRHRRRNPSHPLAAVDYQVSAELSTFVNPVPVFASPSAHGIKFILGSEGQERAKFEFVRVSADFRRAIFSHGPTPGGACASRSAAAID